MQVNVKKIVNWEILFVLLDAFKNFESCTQMYDLELFMIY